MHSPHKSKSRKELFPYTNLIKCGVCGCALTQEKEELTITLFANQKADTHYLKTANIILELAQKAAHLFRNQDSEQKRRLISLLVSNCTYKDGKLDLELVSVFKEIQKTKVVESWCARLDSNQ